MKKLNLFFIAIFGLITLINAHGYGEYNNNKSELNMKLWNHSSFTVIFDNHGFAKSNQFDLANISPGIHHIQVIKLTPNNHGYGGLKRVLYNGTINIPHNSEVSAIVNKNRKLDIRVRKKVGGHGQIDYGEHSGNGHQNGCGAVNGYSCNCNDFDGFGYANNNPQPFYEAAPFVISEPSFNQLVRVVNNTSFDATKLIVVKQALRDNYFTTEQIAILMSHFSFDSHKLVLAKKAYEKVVDKGNYFMVNEQFTFSSSVENLNNYLSQYV